jgi:hypothetical protein
MRAIVPPHPGLVDPKPPNDDHVDADSAVSGQQVGVATNRSGASASALDPHTMAFRVLGICSASCWKFTHP